MTEFRVRDLRSLTRLRVAGCPGVKADDIAAARAAMPNVTILTE